MLKILLLVLVFAVLLYLLIRAVQERKSSPPEQGARRSRDEGPIGPDDDPDFLRGL